MWSRKANKSYNIKLGAVVLSKHINYDKMQHITLLLPYEMKIEIWKNVALTEPCLLVSLFVCLSAHLNSIIYITVKAKKRTTHVVSIQNRIVSSLNFVFSARRNH